MPTTKLPLIIRLTEAQLGYLAYRYTETDPQDALVLECDRTRSLRLAKERVEVLRFDEECTPLEDEPSLPTESGNPIGTI